MNLKRLQRLNVKVQTETEEYVKPMVRIRTEQDEIKEEARRCLLDDDIDMAQIDQIYEQSKHNIKSGFYEDDTMPRIDRKAAKTWYYPSNLAVREYQRKIVESTLTKNTLVCLPTGLGKTLIASVLMYNYYKWFPTGKIVFVAPTTTLVAQQIHACYNVTGIPERDTVSLTGKVNPDKRGEIWIKKRLFFCTPHVVVSDLLDGKCPGKEIVLVVIDEAHYATKNYYYCTMIKYLSQMSNHFRVLALSATPGSSLPAVQEVITNLQIAHVEVRDESDPDVRQYIQDKTVQVNQVRLTGELEELQELLYQLIQVPANKLRNQKAIFFNDITKISKGFLFFAQKNMNNNFHLKGDFQAASDLCALKEKLIMQGLKDFHDSLEAYYSEAFSGKTKSTARANVIKQPSFKILLEKKRSLMRTGAVHPKLLELERVVLKHFEENRKQGTLRETRVIIFATYRETVENIVTRLSKFTGTLKVMKFVGQSSGKRTKGLGIRDQKRVIDEFVRGNYNTLVSTSVGEEGLDIGEVDLIVCYDAVASPTRMIQRMGRTGRKRRGEAIIIVSEGNEAKKYYDSQKKIADLFKTMKTITNPNSGCTFYSANNRMIPDEITPKICMIQMVVDPLLSNFSSPRAIRKKSDKELITASEEDYLNKHYGTHIPDQVDTDNYWRSIVERLNRDTSWRHYQTVVSPIHKVQHSVATTILHQLFRNINEESYDEDLIINMEPIFPFVDDDMMKTFEKDTEEDRQRIIVEAEKINQENNDGYDSDFGGVDNYHADFATDITQHEIVNDDSWDEQSDFGGADNYQPDDIDMNELQSTSSHTSPQRSRVSSMTENLIIIEDKQNIAILDTLNDTSIVHTSAKRRRQENEFANKRAKIVDEWFFSLPPPILSSTGKIMTKKDIQDSVNQMHRKIDQLGSTNENYSEISKLTLSQESSLPKPTFTYSSSDNDEQNSLMDCPRCKKPTFCLETHASLCTMLANSTNNVDKNGAPTHMQIAFGQSSNLSKDSCQLRRKSKTIRDINRNLLLYPKESIDVEDEEFVQKYVLMDSDEQDGRMISSGSSFINDSEI
jgi:ERCC4-related helicase